MTETHVASDISVTTDHSERSNVMAIMVHGGGAQVSGSIGATTYTRDGRARRRSNPQNTVTTRKTEVQGNLAQLAVSFRALSDSQRAQWVGAVSRINRLGQAVTLSSIAAYVAVNAALMACNEAGVDVPPVFDGMTLIATNGMTANVSANAEDQDLSVTLVNSSGVSRKVLIDATAPLSPGINNFINRLRQLACYTKTNGEGNVSLNTAYAAVFGADALGVDSVGKRIGVRVRDLNSGNPIFVGTLSKLASLIT